MKIASLGATILVAALTFSGMGCSHLPGKPGLRRETLRPDQVLDFATLYKTNCSACHGERGTGGPALALKNPVYLAWAGQDRLAQIVANGVPHELMPAFAQSAGGMLTDQQVESIVHGMVSNWGQPGILNGLPAPSYQATTQGDAAQGKIAFQTYCARCHGADGKGIPGGGSNVAGSIVDSSYLALISTQGLRDLVVAGLPGEQMPDWRYDGAHAMTERDVDDVVAWLISHRVAYPGQPFTSTQQQ